LAHAFNDERFHLGLVLWYGWRNTIYAAMEAFKELHRHKRNKEKRQEQIACFQQIWTATNLFGRLSGPDIKWHLTPPEEFLPHELGVRMVPPSGSTEPHPHLMSKRSLWRSQTSLTLSKISSRKLGTTYQSHPKERRRTNPHRTTQRRPPPCTEHNKQSIQIRRGSTVKTERMLTADTRPLGSRPTAHRIRHRIPITQSGIANNNSTTEVMNERRRDADPGQYIFGTQKSIANTTPTGRMKARRLNETGVGTPKH
jgi:hypothetical protein